MQELKHRAALAATIVMPIALAATALPTHGQRPAPEGGSALEQGGSGDRGSGQQETEAGGVGGRDAALTARDDRETRPRHARENGRRLCDADPERIGEAAGEQRNRPDPGSVSVGLLGRPPEIEEDGAGQHEAPGGEAHAAEGVVDLVLERDPDHGCRNRRDEQQADEPPAGPDGVPALGSGPTGSRERAHEPEDLAAQIDQCGGQRSQMDHDLEEDPRTSERLIGQERPPEHQVSRTGDRQELGDALDESPDHGFQHASGEYPEDPARRG